MAQDWASTEYARAHMSRSEWRMMRRAEFEVWLRSVAHSRRRPVPECARDPHVHRTRRDPG